MSEREFQRCRTCLGRSEQMMNIKQQLLYPEKLSIAEILLDCTEIFISIDDALPQTICSDCAQKAKEAFDFKKTCKASNEKLLKELLEIKLETEETSTITPIPELVQISPCIQSDLFADENFSEDEKHEKTDEDNDVLATETNKDAGSIHIKTLAIREKQICSDSIEAAADIEMVNRAKLVNGRFQCELCEKSLADRRTFLLHTRLHLNYKLKHCSICGRGFAKQNHLSRHKKIHEKSKEKKRKIRSAIETEIKTSIPSLCITSNSNEISVENTDEEKNTDNDNDDKELKLINSAKEIDGRLQCPVCDKTLSHRRILRLHLRALHLRTNLFFCQICGRGFAKGSNLNRHRILHSKMESKYHSSKFESIDDDGRNNIALKHHSCNQCDKSFTKLKQLEAHHSRHHLDRSQKIFTCDTCNKTFNRADNLKSHQRVHLPPEKREIKSKQFLCPFCGRSFSNSSNLTVHIRRHTGEKPFVCDFESCTARFPRSSDLQCHRRTHTGEKTCICTICGKGFSRSNKLVRHSRTHTGERPYQCPHCYRSFTQSNDLTLHIRRHTGDRPFICDHCGMRFITNSLLQQHQRTTGHMNDSNPLPTNSVNNPHRMFHINDGKKTGITATLTSLK